MRRIFLGILLGLLLIAGGSAVDPSTVLQMHMNGTANSTTFTDSWQYNHVFSAAGSAQIWTSPYKFGGASGHFPVNGDNVSTADSSDWDLGGSSGTDNWTIDFWTYPDGDFESAARGVMAHYQDSNNYWFVAYYESYIMFYHMVNGNDQAYQQFHATIGTSGWYHIAIEHDNSTANYRCYLNGVAQSAWSNVGVNVLDISGRLQIGSRGMSVTSVRGYLDEVRISKGVVRWTAAFTPPTAQYVDPPAANLPVAAFHASPLVVWRNGTIQFTDDTTNTPTSWNWYDPDTANPLFTGNLSNQNPKVFPRNWGYHSVNLIACNGAGCSTKASGARYIYVLPPGVI